MLAVNVGESESSVRDFANGLNLDFPLLLDVNASIVNSWPARGLPATFVISPDGKIYYRALGGREWDAPEILQMLRNLQKTQPIEQPALQKTAGQE
jgi:peroxiredoxin